MNGHTDLTERPQPVGRQGRPPEGVPAKSRSTGGRAASRAAESRAASRLAGPRQAGARPLNPRPGTRLPGPRPVGAGRPATPHPAAVGPATAPPVAPPAPHRARQGSPYGTVRTARPAQPGHRPAAESRTRFVFLVVGLLGGGLLCLLIINTVLATGAFRITALQQGNVSLAQHVQSLQAQIAAEESPASLAQRAAALGMQIQPRLHFLNLTTGRLQSEPSQMPGIPTVPGYAP